MAGRIKKRKTLSYAKWGYIFILPFFIVYALFQLYPLLTTFVYAFQDVRSTGEVINNGWNNFDNFRYLFVETKGAWLKSFGITMIMQFMGFIPQLIVSLVLAVWFTDSRLKLKGAMFFKAVIYMPNLIMATAMASMFQSMFNGGGPFYEWYAKGHGGYTIFDSIWDIRWLVGFINFTMWFGNTTILLMAGVMGIDDSIFEAATVDGAKKYMNTVSATDYHAALDNEAKTEWEFDSQYFTVTTMVGTTKYFIGTNILISK